MNKKNDSDVVWFVGEDKLNIKRKSSGIRVWKLGDVHIYPHIALNTLIDYPELVEFATKISENLKNKGIKCVVWEKNTCSREINGAWNVVISIPYFNHKYNKHFSAMYMFRRCHYYKNTYCCPFYNKSNVTEHSVDSIYSQKEFEAINTAIMGIYPNAEHIDSFPVHDV